MLDVLKRRVLCDVLRTLRHPHSASIQVTVDSLLNLVANFDIVYDIPTITSKYNTGYGVYRKQQFCVNTTTKNYYIHVLH